jgi:DNA-binding transcriptional MerR regulator
VAKPTPTRKAFYLDIKDTIEEVGISRRQLGHWQDQGLISPELGPEAKRYTESDIARLKILKQLVVDQRLPIPFVKELVEGSPAFGWMSAGSTVLLDLDRNQLIPRDELSRELWDEFLAAAPEAELEERLYDLGLILSRVLRTKNRSDATYSARRSEIMRVFNGFDFVGRIEWVCDENGNEAHPQVDPFLGTESYKQSDLVDWVKGQRWRINRLQAVGDRLWEDDQLRWEQYSRFWSKETMAAIAAMDTQSQGQDDDEAVF